MMLPDDCTLGADQAQEVRAAARRALEEAGAIGVFPTPVDQILDAARVEIVPLAIDEGYLARLRQKAEAAGKALLSAISKVWGVFDPHARVAFIDPETPKDKLPFLKLHEGGHAVLPWQKAFGLFEDCRKTLDPEVKSGFEREANVFASEVLFQIDAFGEEAKDMAFGIKTPLALAKRYGASVYATVRRYVTSSDRICAVLVFNPGELKEGFGLVSELRRAVSSPTFQSRFPTHVWPTQVSSGDDLGKAIPFGRMSAPRPLVLVDADGERHPFVAEAFKTPYQTFVLLHAEATLGRKLILPMSAALV
ncbi:hypothetical protein ABC365_00085 [Brevundimonas sp. 3P9-tot-E]|jgi:hypothetical protein|uniref:ImmA/IrrE family metallo-endopeptidase n=1 Tax=Brevundimonas TaxID=41275 RepID=UPI0008CE4993|nr:MAG: hypothetical protein A2352_09135 [Caulobacterales bacterium RIFOXYB1_FULL_67_16]